MDKLVSSKFCIDTALVGPQYANEITTSLNVFLKVLHGKVSKL